MSREILFRGKVANVPKYLRGRMKIGDWVYGSYVTYPMPQIIDLEDWYEVDPATVGQFTEWYDDNNEKIFDGDILQIDDPDQDELYTSRVRCEKGTYLVHVRGEDFDTCDIRYAIDQIWDMNDCKYIVIGNIHDTQNIGKKECSVQEEEWT